MNWISCKEDLPKDPAKYFCCVTAKGFLCDEDFYYRDYVICHYSTVYGRWFPDVENDINIKEVLAWMPIPKYEGN
jgi:hypothetical protein